MSPFEQIAAQSMQDTIARRTALLSALTSPVQENENLEAAALYDRFFSLDETSRYSITNSMASTKSAFSRGLMLQILERDDSPLVRHEAAFALGCVGDDSCRLSLRRSLLEDKSFLVRHEAAMALGELGTGDDVPTLKAGLIDTSREVVISCEVALNRILERISARTTKQGAPIGNNSAQS